MYFSFTRTALRFVSGFYSFIRCQLVFNWFSALSIDSLFLNFDFYQKYQHFARIDLKKKIGSKAMTTTAYSCIKDSYIYGCPCMNLRKPIFTYHKVASSDTSFLKAHAGFFQIAYEGDFWPLCTVTFSQKVDFPISNVH